MHATAIRSIYFALSDGCKTIREIAKACDLPSRDVRPMLATLASEGYLYNVDSTCYAIVDSARYALLQRAGL